MKDQGPFAASPKQIVYAALLSVALHAGFVLSCSNRYLSSHASVAPAAKKLHSPCMYEPIPAAKQRALTETLNRFFPFIATPGHKKQKGLFGAPAKETSFELLASSESKGASFGEDCLTLVNFNSKGPELPALTSGDGADAMSFPFDSALNLDNADIIRQIEVATNQINGDIGDLKTEQSNVASSTVMLSEHPSSEPFELETHHLLFERETISLRSPRLFAKGGEEGLFLPPPMAPGKEPSDLLPLMHVEAKEFVAADKKGELGEIISDHFQCKSASCQLPGEPLFVFRIEIEPTSLTHFQALDNEVLFVIDRSHSIAPDTFHHFKSAVSHALGLLPKSCRFNVAFFDRHVTPFEETSPVATRNEIIRAKTFLIGQDHGGLFASTDLFKALSALKISDAAVTSALILTDGDTFLCSTEEKGELLRFIENKNPNLSIFAAATGESNNLKLLSEVTAFCRGHLIYEQEPAALQRRFASLVRSLSFPIAKDICLAIQKEEERKVFFLTPAHRLPVLYGRSPYVVYGTTDRPGPLTLFIQGKGARGPVTIKKQIVVEKTGATPADILKEIEGIHQINSLETLLRKR